MAKLDATRACVVCGNAFAVNGRQNACSAKCKDERTKQVVHKCKVKAGIARDKEQKTCAGCGKTFATARASQVHCSTACKQSVKVALSKRACVVCGTEFEMRGHAVTCSALCSTTRQRENERASAIRTGRIKGPKQLTCAHCKATFVGVANKTFCSAKCKEAARRLDPEYRARQRQHSAQWAKRNYEKNRVAQAQSAKKRRAENGRGDRSKEYQARRARIGRPVRPVVSVDRVMIPIKRMVRAFRGAEQSIRRMVGRCDSPVYGMTEVEEFRWMYRNDPLFRQEQIQRTRKQKLKRKALQSSELTSKQARAICSERSSCLYCGCLLAVKDRVLDHMDPLSKGGAHDASNLVVACKKCNTRKAAKTFVQWLYFVPEDRRELIANWYARKHGAPPEQIGIGLLMAA